LLKLRKQSNKYKSTIKTEPKFSKELNESTKNIDKTKAFNMYKKI